MKHSKLVNFKAISEELTNNSRKIKQSNTAAKYEDILLSLDEFIDLWLQQSKRALNKGPEPKAKRNTSGLRRGRSN